MDTLTESINPKKLSSEILNKNLGIKSSPLNKTKKVEIAESRFPTFLGLLLLIMEVVVGLLFIQNKNLESLALKNIVNPKDVRISNISDNGFTVSWITDKKTSGYVLYGTDKDNKSNKQLTIQNENDVYVHTANITNLDPDKVYYFSIVSNKFSFNGPNESGDWQVNTSKNIGPAKENEILAGKIIRDDDEPVANANVFVNVNGSPLISTITDDSGLWVINLGTAITQNLSEYMTLTKGKSPIDIYVQSGIYGITYGRATFSDRNILEPMKLGKGYVFNPDNDPEFENSVPRAQLTI